MSPLYQSLTTLAIGDAIPDHLMILDYASGERPNWRVVEREELGAGGVKLVLEDADNRDMFSAVRVVVLTFPAKTLRTQPQLGREMTGRLCDLVQQQRYWAKREAR